ncbi:MAG: bifunctional phosphoribosylaminoimidazolecarboxamide formyltransferase/IMP cyclohydrolase [Deltaproteobacteria bacterium RIFCSPLOWO2_02_FULL_44_10]|nr:MAG: bifunctional phosphoribosylaminoimidazolecarboxamide formyltransferase/IMP cyclohydrolase [Deltaproteobacteria bacterium RIFCSPHIGHO2_02_FULL_44_16]OGQ44989.1 MAG: bifunctional phosphoribosylaminoimidazolecarboxamide formyltransferase/IMP cyclohydrolase [Deltaproteobacteria bacterium RIFCSPLOWO2_02_FULL_44_10]
MKIKRALISVTDKTGIVAFAQELAALGVEILSTGGTAKVLRDAGIVVRDVSDYTGSPEILDGRLKTLHPKIHGGLLAIRQNKIHLQELKEQKIETIDLVVVNLYAFEKTVADGCSLSHAIEHIDIGGPTMLRAAAKNYHDVAVIVDHADYVSVLEEMKKNQGELSKGTKFRLAQKVFATTARYDAAIANYLTGFENEEKVADFPKTLGLIYEKAQALRYGENPHQRAALYRDVSNMVVIPAKAGISGDSRLRGNDSLSEPSIFNARQLHGKELSYNNIMDADAALSVIKDFNDAPFAAVIIKHANPCGASVSSMSLADAFCKARDADALSAFGGIVALSRELDKATAEAIGETFFEVILAPSFSDEAKVLLSKKKNLRLLEVEGLGKRGASPGLTLRKVAGGLLVQDRDVGEENIHQYQIVTKRSPSQEEGVALNFAWRLCKHVKSNAIVIASEDQTFGIGAGQTSRVDAVEQAIKKLNSQKIPRRGTQSLGSDAFFPFRDGVDIAAKAGITAIIQPGGSLRDDEVIEAANEHNIAMVFTGKRHFHH